MQKRSLWLAVAAVACVVAIIFGIAFALGGIDAAGLLGAGVAAIVALCAFWQAQKSEALPVEQAGDATRRWTKSAPKVGGSAALGGGGTVTDGTQPSASAGVRSVEMLFATNRVPATDPGRINFTGDRADALTFGVASVHVPRDRKIGTLEVPKKVSYLKLRFTNQKEDPEKHFILETVGLLDRQDFIDEVAAGTTHTALVFVHGFNVSFEESALRFAQIIWDMQFHDIPVLFSWPSSGGLFNYLYDKESVDFSRDTFRQLIEMLRNDAKIQTLHIIAHSMGNLLVLEALSALAPGVNTIVKELVMAAPDVDVDIFRGLLAKVQSLVSGMTLYASANDRALVASHAMHKKPRAGDVFATGPILASRLDSIDVSAIGTE
jgi:esterase/lipase superfamily enzyme